MELKPFDGKLKTILDLAQSYYDSYVSLSEGYKSKKEMALYKKGTFIKKLKKIALDESSKTFVYFENGKPLGFARYSPIPEFYYNTSKENSEVESGVTANGYNYYWKRKLDFFEKNEMDDKTIMLNQIYLNPSVQNKGVGTWILEQTLPEVLDSGYDSLVIEYNSNNQNARKFYANTLGIKEIGKTRDFDNVVSDPTEICMSPVTIGYGSIDNAINRIKLLKASNVKRGVSR